MIPCSRSAASAKCPRPPHLSSKLAIFFKFFSFIPCSVPEGQSGCRCLRLLLGFPQTDTSPPRRQGVSLSPFKIGLHLPCCCSLSASAQVSPTVGTAGWFLTLLPVLHRPGWLKQLFTDFISFTLKLVLKSEVRSATACGQRKDWFVCYTLLCSRMPTR